MVRITLFTTLATLLAAVPSIAAAVIARDSASLYPAVARNDANVVHARDLRPSPTSGKRMTNAERFARGLGPNAPKRRYEASESRLPLFSSWLVRVCSLLRFNRSRRAQRAFVRPRELPCYNRGSFTDRQLSPRLCVPERYLRHRGPDI